MELVAEPDQKVYFGDGYHARDESDLEALLNGIQDIRVIGASTVSTVEAIRPRLHATYQTHCSSSNTLGHTVMKSRLQQTSMCGLMVQQTQLSITLICSQASALRQQSLQLDLKEYVVQCLGN